MNNTNFHSVSQLYKWHCIEDVPDMNVQLLLYLEDSNCRGKDTMYRIGKRIKNPKYIGTSFLVDGGTVPYNFKIVAWMYLPMFNMNINIYDDQIDGVRMFNVDKCLSCSRTECLVDKIIHRCPPDKMRELFKLIEKSANDNLSKMEENLDEAILNPNKALRGGPLAMIEHDNNENNGD